MEEQKLNPTTEVDQKAMSYKFRVYDVQRGSFGNNQMIGSTKFIEHVGTEYYYQREREYKEQ